MISKARIRHRVLCEPPPDRAVRFRWATLPTRLITTRQRAAKQIAPRVSRVPDPGSGVTVQDPEPNSPLSRTGVLKVPISRFVKVSVPCVASPSPTAKNWPEYSVVRIARVLAEVPGPPVAATLSFASKYRIGAPG